MAGIGSINLLISLEEVTGAEAAIRSMAKVDGNLTQVQALQLLVAAVISLGELAASVRQEYQGSQEKEHGNIH